MKTKKDIENERTKLISGITNQLTLLIDDVQKQKPEKAFTIRVYEENMYWCVNWESTKLWKTDQFLKEYFQVQIWKIGEKYSLEGEHRVEDIFEHLSDQYFLYEGMTMQDLILMTDEIVEKTRAGVLEAVDKEIDSSY
ncbi:hypothetical protein [Roseivirga echinicomitans]|uniref:Uncharacterized protein n=1 Tax=Roseivirga echinicomitans TaxID=296218 RepID=A0A150WYK1_9BACT|nr:hypothetical protein [Roseivirga echinicomitans]KYG71544.1 hypothetical protein AWN68_12425 [Roseivirga echinicomitans]